MSFRFFALAGLAILASTAAADATTINYVTNGSFQQGYSGWSVTTGAGAVGPGLGPELAVTDGVTKNRYGDVIVSDNAVSPDPDSNKGGNEAAYFVDDVAAETVSEKIYLTPGVYEVGFDLYATASGFKNVNDSIFSATIAGTTVTSGDITQYGSSTWEHFAANADVLYAGYYNVAFVFQGGAYPAKDIVVDDVYAINPSTLPGSGTAVVPEPASLAMMTTMLGFLLIARCGILGRPMRR
jgi:hypothetical protein